MIIYLPLRVKVDPLWSHGGGRNVWIRCQDGRVWVGWESWKPIRFGLILRTFFRRGRS